MFEAATLPQLAWTIIGVVIALAVLGVMHTLASAIRNEAELHMLRVQVYKLRAARITEIRDLYGLEESEPSFDIVDDEAGEDAEPAPVDAIPIAETAEASEADEPAEDKRAAA